MFDGVSFGAMGVGICSLAGPVSEEIRAAVMGTTRSGVSSTRSSGQW